MENTIKASVSRKSVGWIPVLEFPNGGRQEFESYYYTDKLAMRAAKKCLKGRLEHPLCVIPDPVENQLISC